MNYEDLTKRLKRAKRDKLRGELMWWNGYIAALNDIRNNIKRGDKT